MRVSSCRPPRSVSGLVWVIGPLICGTRHVSGNFVWVKVVYGIFRGILLLRNADPPRSGAGVDLDKNDCAYGTQDRLAFCAILSLFCRHFLAPPLLRVVYRWLSLKIYSCPLQLGLPLFLSFVASLVGLLTLPFRGVGMGFEEQHLRFMLARGIGVTMNFPFFCIYLVPGIAQHSGLVLWYCFG